MLVSDFDYNLPSERIAQQPLEHRDASRLLVLERTTGRLHDAGFRDIGQWLAKGDLLVLNDTRVMPARIFGRLGSGGSLEMLLLRPAGDGLWEVLTRPARKARPGTSVDFGSARAIVVERRPDGMRVVRFEPANVAALLEEQGELALPPYIREVCRDPERYQTVYARQQGAVAAPTAGLHFTPRLLDELRAAGVETVTVTLHAGLGTFRPVKAEKVEDHAMHAEEFELTDSAAEQVNRALTNGRRVVCAGTTTVRVLEGQSGEDGHVQPGRGQTSLYIYPGYRWKVAGAVLTNFHLPKSTLLMLVSAFAGREKVLRAYKHAITEKYRFYSFGDAMFII